MKICVTAIILLFYSCKVSDTDLIGQYKAESYHRSTIILDSTKQFKFLNDGLELAVRNENFLCTQGTWKRTTANKLVLNSISDTIAIPPFDISKQRITDSDKSRFIFFDLNRDTVLIYTVYKNGKIVFFRSHGPFLTSFEDSLVKSDTLMFKFTWGFKRVQIAIDSKEPTEYIITLNREFRPNYFRNTEFTIRRNKLIRISNKTKFSKTKSNGI